MIVLTEKEPLMNEIMTEEQLSVPYNPNLLVTYKYVADTYGHSENATFMTDKVTQIEWELHNGRTNAAIAAERRGDIAWFEDQIPEWYDPNYSKEDVLKAILERFSINPMKEISVYGTVSFSGTIQVPLDEVEDFDLSNITVDAELSSYDCDGYFTVDDVSLEEN
jgi:hypothetical protein